MALAFFCCMKLKGRTIGYELVNNVMYQTKTYSKSHQVRNAQTN